MTPIISAKGLSHLYSAGTPFESTAIENINLDIKEGQFVGLIGHTGSGKSTFIQHLNGLLKPTGGTVAFRGRDIWESKDSARDVRFKVGLVFQYPEYQLFEETVYKDIAFGPKNMKLSDSEIDGRIREAAEFVGVDSELFNKSPLELSGGQKRRVAIAGVIAMRPEVLVLDEPTSGLDPKGRDNILANISDYHKTTGSTIILVTHSMDEIARIAERLIVFRDGSIAMDGSPEEVFSRADELADMGLAVPEATRIASRLATLGVPLTGPVYTLEQLKNAILLRKGGTLPC